MSLSSSLEQPGPVVVHGFDLVPVVIAQSPDHDLSTSVVASLVSTMSLQKEQFKNYLLRNKTI